MQIKKLVKEKWLTILMVVGGWSLAALFTMSYMVLQDYSRQRFHPLSQILAWQFATALGWIILTPLIFLLVEKFPLDENKKIRRNIGVHILAGLGIVLTRQAIDAFVQPLLGFPPGANFTSYFESFRFLFIVDFHFSFITYCVALGLVFAVRYYRKFRRRELKAIELEARLAQARMHVLKMQLQPHFLFNTHNAILELIYKDPKKAEQMLIDLSDLLRLSLEKMEIEEVPLKQEIEFLNKYLQIEQTRFQDRLSIKFEVPAETLIASVPNMILQPLVENAIKHGIGPRVRGGTVSVKAAAKDQNLFLEVSDDGIGVPFNNPAEIVKGIGLSNVQARLENMYGDKQIFKITPNGKSGLCINLTIPFTEFVMQKEKFNGGENNLWKSAL